MNNSRDLVKLALEMTELLRGSYTVSNYFHVIFPFLLLRRFDCILAGTKEAVLAAYTKHSQHPPTVASEPFEQILNDISGQRLHNHSPLDLTKIHADPLNVHLNLISYNAGFSANVREIFTLLGFDEEIKRLREANILFLLVKRLCELDLNSDVVSSAEMMVLIDQLFQSFNRLGIEVVGEHSSPPDLARLMADVLFTPDTKRLADSSTVCTLFDPTCGTGNMLSEAGRYFSQHLPASKLIVNGQEIDAEWNAIAMAKLLLTEHIEEFSIKLGDSLTADLFPGQCFDYFIAHPPFGLDWKRQQKEITKESEQLGFAGRFGAGLPRTQDGSLLFLQHMLAKFKPVTADAPQAGSRLAIIFNAAPLFSGGAGSGESEIRKWVIENDWLEAIIALPPEMLYHTGDRAYIWLLSNRKTPTRRGKIQLIDARNRADARLKPHLGHKWKELTSSQIADILRDYTSMEESTTSKMFANTDFGYSRLTIERPLRLTYQITIQRKESFLDACPELLDDLQAIEQHIGCEPYLDWNNVWAWIQRILRKRNSKWRLPQIKCFRDVFTEINPSAISVNSVIPLSGAAAYEADPALRDYENVPLKEDLQAWFAREVLPHAPDAWIDHSKTKIGYEINFHRYFYQIVPSRPLAEIDADLNRVEEKIVRLLMEVTA